ncbi:MAG: hypothetical protein IJE89_03155 [Bacilli bacterium]|nr:hypothetical protein [Bacilli bacterium]
MNRLPTKQIYLLTIIIVGIIALSVYSTYAIFTFESETSDIVSIHTPKSLQISENVYEYQQLVIKPNTVATTDIDIYNAYEYEICYSIWYKILGDINIQNKVQILEISKEGLTSSGVMQPSSNLRVTIAIINDNEEEIKINIGTIGSQKEIDSCSLNLSDDKSVISEAYNSIEKLTTKLLEEKDTQKVVEEKYLTYNDITEVLTYTETDKMFISDKFSYKEELFTLENSEELTIKELIDKEYLETKDIYFCKEGTSCSILYKITDLETEEIDTEEKNNIIYKITKYDKLIGYSKSTNGLRQVNDKDYVYYGDNPNNFIYYNCENDSDVNSCDLWRIIGFFYDEETDEYNTKIIKNDSIGKYQFDKKNNKWEDSTLYKYLNEEYKFINNYDIYIEEYSEKVERISSLETDIKNIKLENEIINSKLRLLNISDYLYTSSCQNTKINEYKNECITNNWLNNIEIEKEWTLTSKEVIEKNQEQEEILDSEGNEEISDQFTDTKEVINYVYSIGKNIEENNVSELLDIRPVIFLKSRMLLLDGKGSKEEPYIVK